MNIDFYVSPRYSAWMPQDLETGLGGAEEAVVRLAQEMMKHGHWVRVYHRQPNGPIEGTATAKGDGRLSFLAIEAFDPNAERDVLIGVRCPEFFHGPHRRARVQMHLSCDVENPWHHEAIQRVDHHVNLSDYHRARQVWLPDTLARVIPLGCDPNPHAKPGSNDPTVAIYTSSPDRGLHTLLKDWPRIREHFPDLVLHVTYGFAGMDMYTAVNPELRALKAELEALLKQDGVVSLGKLPRDEMDKLYARASWWFMPLNRPDSELYCISADKAGQCGAIRVVHPHGALQEIGQHVPYDEFVKGNVKVIGSKPRPAIPWADLVEKLWLPLMNPQAKEAA